MVISYTNGIMFLEVKANYKVKARSNKHRLTPTARLAKNQINKVELSFFFSTINSVVRFAFPDDLDTSREEKALYITMVSQFD